MRIVMVSPYFPPHLGGVEVVVKELSAGLAKSGNKVEIITSGISQKGDFSPRENVFVRTLFSFELAHIPLAPNLFKKIYDSIKNADVLNVHAGIAFYPEVSFIAAKIQKKPFVVTFHCDTRPSGAFGFLLPLYNKVFLKRVLSSANGVVCLTLDNAKMVNKVYGVKKEKIVVIPNGVGGDYFNFGPRIKKGKKINLLFVGRLAKQKNLPRLFEAVKLLSKRYDVVLRVVGEGEEEKNLKEKVVNLGLGKNVIFCGAYAKDDVLKWGNLYKQTDIFVLSSDYEGVPMALMEAMAGGIPVVATDVMGVRDFAKGLALLVEPSPEALSKGIEKLYNDNHLRSSLSKKARNAMKRFSWEFIAEKYECLYKSVI